MSILHQGTTLTPDSLVERFAAALRPDGAMHDLAGTAGSLELLVETTRATVLADIAELAVLESVSPRGKLWFIDGPWPYTESFYLSVTAARFEQLLDSAQALAVLHRAGAHRAGWAVLEQAGKTLTRLWMLTETTVFDQPWDEARRSGHGWGAFSNALACVEGIPEFTPHPFDTVYTDDVSELAEDSLRDAASAAPDDAKYLVNAIRLGAALAAIHVPAHLQIGPEAVTTMPTAASGLDSAELTTAQIQLAVELIRSAAASTRAALDTSLEHRDT